MPEIPVPARKSTNVVLTVTAADGADTCSAGRVDGRQRVVDTPTDFMREGRHKRPGLQTCRVRMMISATQGRIVSAERDSCRLLQLACANVAKGE